MNNYKVKSLNTKVLGLLLVIFGIMPQLSNAQDLPISNAKKYEIAEINVTGSTSYNESTVIAFTGLKVGDELYVPGDKLSKVLKKLWDLGLFSDINFYLTKVEDGKAYLELEIVEVPKLETAKVRGIKERKRNDLIKDFDVEKGTKLTDNFRIKLKNGIEKKYRKKVFTMQMQKSQPLKLAIA